MKNNLFIGFLLLLLSCNTQTNLTIYNYEQLKPLLHKTNEKTYVVNFWATWCAPCVKEMPYFEKLNETYKNKNVEVILVNLDFPKDYDSKLKPFIKAHNLQSKIIAFDDLKSNYWITDIAEDWTGALPATLIYNKNKRQFYERTFTYNELETELLTFL